MWILTDNQSEKGEDKPGLLPSYEIIRLLHPLRVLVVAFLNPTLAGRMEVSWNKTEQSPAALSSLPTRLDRISGVAFLGTLTQADLPVDASLSVQSCGSPPASFPPDPHGQAVAFRSRLPSVGPAEVLFAIASASPIAQSCPAYLSAGFACYHPSESW